MLGGEQSGHVIFRDRATHRRRTAHGGAVPLARGRDRGARSGELASVMHRYPQRMINVEVADRAVADDRRRCAAAVADAEAALGLDGRVLVRASGTEPLVRVMVEAETEDLASEHAERIAEAVRAAAS